MKILVIGAAGMIGRKLVDRLVREGALGGATHHACRSRGYRRAVRAEGAPFAVDDRGRRHRRALYRAQTGRRANPTSIFLLASIVSGEAEADFDKGYAINLDGTRKIFEAIRQRHLRSEARYRPRVVFTSSIAVFGAPFPEVIEDEYFTTPLTSYGTQKAICELLLSDYSRRGFFDGRRHPPADDLRAAGQARIWRRRAFSPTSSASRWRARRRCCRSPRACATGTLRRARRSASSFTPRRSIRPRSARAAT